LQRHCTMINWSEFDVTFLNSTSNFELKWLISGTILFYSLVESFILNAGLFFQSLFCWEWKGWNRLKLRAVSNQFLMAIFVWVTPVEIERNCAQFGVEIYICICIRIL
jgi:hypothetical protein